MSLFSQNSTVTKIQTLQAGSGDFVEMGSQRISLVSDQANGFGCSKEKNDSFLVDIDDFGNSVDMDSNHNTRITRNLSRKGFLLRAGDKRKCASSTSNERNGCLISVSNSSPKASTVESNMGEATLGVGKHLAKSASHHQITITTGNENTKNGESKWNNRRSYSFKRPPPSTWISDPKKILFFFATLSSMGTIVLIILTLSMKASVKYAAGDQQV